MHDRNGRGNRRHGTAWYRTQGRHASGRYQEEQPAGDRAARQREHVTGTAEGGHDGGHKK